MASVPTGCSLVSVPVIVASGSFLSRTTNLSSTTVFTTTTAGLYRLTLFAEGHIGANKSPLVDASMTGTDDEGNAIQVANDTTMSFGGDAVGHMPSGTNVNVTASIESGSPTYSVYYTVEQLQ